MNVKDDWKVKGSSYDLFFIPISIFLQGLREITRHLLEQLISAAKIGS